MKVLLFSDKNDIDGMGSVILSKLAFEDLKYILTDNINLQTEIKKLYEEKELYNYDMIYITDMWLFDDTLKLIANDNKLDGKLFVFDHHKSAIEEGLDRYPFTKIIIQDEKGRVCGTSLFYNYLKDNNLINDSKEIYQFVELTRKFDTWEWKTRYDEIMPYDLNILFDVIGYKNYIDVIYKKLKEEKDFKFTDSEKLIIDNRKQIVNEKIKEYLNTIILKEISGYKAAIVFLSYEYRNDFAQELRQATYPADFVIMICLEKNMIYYRSIKFTCNVRLIAESFGGKGNDYSASSPIDNDLKEEIIDILFK